MLHNEPLNNYELFASRLSELTRAEGMLKGSKTRFNADIPTALLKKVTYVSEFLGISKSELVILCINRELTSEIDVIMDKVVRIRRGEKI